MLKKYLILRQSHNSKTIKSNLIITLSIFSFFITIQCNRNLQLPDPPDTRKDTVVDILHGKEIPDPYRWLEDQQSEETREWIGEQNDYTHSVLQNIEGRDQLKERLTRLIRVNAIGTPTEANGRYFFYRRDADQDLAVIYMREGLDGEDELLIDPHTMSEDHILSVNLLDISKDGKLLAYGIQQGGEDELVVRLFNVDDKKNMSDELTKARYWSVSITPDNKGFYYTRFGSEGGRVYYHEIGTKEQKDKLIFGDKYGPEKILFSSLSDDGKNLLYHVMEGSSGKTEIYYQKAGGQYPVLPVLTGIDARSFAGIEENTIFLQTNWNAPNQRILKVNVDQLPVDTTEWTEVIPESDAVIDGITSCGEKIVVAYLKDVVSQLKIFEKDGKHLQNIELPALGSIGNISGHWESDELFYSFSSFHIPTTIYRYDLSSNEQKLWARLDVDVNIDEIEVEQVWYPSKDQTKVPMFLVHKKGIKLNNSHPVLLNAYGGFGVSRSPAFSSTAIGWVEYGGVYALANIRGGGELGEKWHEAGMLDKKQNSFDDFIAAAEWLIDNGYTSSKKLSAVGGSNGGLLMGAMLTQRPELFKAIACFNPLLDMIRYHQFLVGRFWIPEYGSADDPEQFKYILDYSPYQNVKSGTSYPATIFISGDADTRVDPLHARKMAALVQAANTSDNPILLLYDTTSGHSGGLPVSKQIDDKTDWMSFVMWQVGILDYSE